eukprot:4835718-Pyramimonas_sp.AAC.1
MFIDHMVGTPAATPRNSRPVSVRLYLPKCLLCAHVRTSASGAQGAKVSRVPHILHERGAARAPQA